LAQSLIIIYFLFSIACDSSCATCRDAPTSCVECAPLHLKSTVDGICTLFCNSLNCKVCNTGVCSLCQSGYFIKEDANKTCVEQKKIYASLSTIQKPGSHSLSLSDDWPELIEGFPEKLMINASSLVEGLDYNVSITENPNNKLSFFVKFNFSEVLINSTSVYSFSVSIKKYPDQIPTTCCNLVLTSWNGELNFTKEKCDLNKKWNSGKFIAL
jgi:hypothetical protein